MKRTAAAFLAALLLAASAAADPVLSDLRHTAWLGEEGYLFIEDDTGAIKRLPTPIRDLLAMDDASIICYSRDGHLYDIRLDGTPGRVISSAPTAADLRSAAGEAVFRLEEGVLRLPGRTEPVAEHCLAACTAGGILYYVTEGTDGCLLESIALPQDAADPLALQPVAVLHDIAVSRPISLYASDEAVTLVAEDHAVEAVSFSDHSVTRLAATHATTAAAVYADGKLFRYRYTAAEGYVPELISQMVLGQTAGRVQATTAPAPTPTPRPASATAYIPPTATPKPTATVRPTAMPEEDDGTLRKGDRGSEVRKMQNRLLALGYPVGKADGAFGDQTLFAVNLFQDAIGVRNRSYMSPSMLRKLYASSAPLYDLYRPLKQGDQGVSVAILQQKLLEKGYNPGKIDGIYGTNTTAAVALYQQQHMISLLPGEKPGELASREMLMQLYDDPAGTYAPVVTYPPVITYQPIITNPPVITYQPVYPTYVPVTPTDIVPVIPPSTPNISIVPPPSASPAPSSPPAVIPTSPPATGTDL